MSAVSVQRTQSQRAISAINYTLYVIVALRAMITYADEDVLMPLLALLTLFLLLLVTKSIITRQWSAYRRLYLGVRPRWSW
jgi:hypothetical protein